MVVVVIVDIVVVFVNFVVVLVIVIVVVKNVIIIFVIVVVFDDGINRAESDFSNAIRRREKMMSKSVNEIGIGSKRVRRGSGGSDGRPGSISMRRGGSTSEV